MKFPKINLGAALRAIVPILAPIAASKLSDLMLKGADKLTKAKAPKPDVIATVDAIVAKQRGGA